MPCVAQQLIRYARDCAFQHLSDPCGDAWAKSERAAHLAEVAAAELQRPRSEMIVAAAWLHAIGQAPDLRLTGLPPVDGAQYLLSQGWPYPVVALVAHQAQSRMLAATYGAQSELALVNRIQGWPADIIDYAVVMSAGSDVDECLRACGRSVPGDPSVPARIAAEREKRLRRAVDRVTQAMALSGAGSLPVGT
jgi:hypothetical protein